MEEKRFLAREEAIGEFLILPILVLCSNCGERELVVVTDKLESVERVESVVCKHKDQCALRAMYELGEGGLE